MSRKLILLTKPCPNPEQDTAGQLIELPQHYGVQPNAGLIQLEIERANKCIPVPLCVVRARAEFVERSRF